MPFFHSSPPTFPFRFLLFRLDVEGGGCQKSQDIGYEMIDLDEKCTA
jgi:hypothetical protein